MSKPLRSPRQGWFDFFGGPVEVIIQTPRRPVFSYDLCSDPVWRKPAPEPVILQPEVEVVTPEVVAPAWPPYREREWMLEQAATFEYPLGLFKVNRKWVSVMPFNLQAAMRLETYRYTDPQAEEDRQAKRRLRTEGTTLVQSCLRLCLSTNSERLHFLLHDLIGPAVQDTFLYRHLKIAGFDLVVSPSLRHFAECEARRIERNLTALDMPEFVDDRALFDRIETGTLLRCITPFEEYTKDSMHLVTTANAEDDFIRLHEIKSGKGNTTAKARKWGPADGALEPYFEEADQHVKIYDHATSVVARYPQLVEQNTRKLEGLRGKLFLHTAYDASQMGVKDHAYFGKPMRMGKAQPLDAKILTPNGWKLMGKIKVGDLVFGSAGKPQTVTGVYPQGIKEVFRVVFSDESETECCDDHLWQVNTPSRKCDGSKPLVLSLKDIVARGLYDGAFNARFYIPIVEPVEFPHRDLPLDPYALGLLLGDGTLGCGKNGYGTPSFTSADPETVHSLEMALPEGMKAVHRRAYDYDLVKPNGHGVKNRLAQILEDLNLRHRSEGQFIPHIYKFASVEQRRKLLSGLLDSDGGPWKQQRANTATPVEFTSVSEKLADDVRFLVQSLGGRAIKASRTTFYTHKGERRKGQRSYRIRISFASGWNPFILKRKADMYKPCTKFLPSRAIVRVDCIGRKRCQCISVAAPDGLYVTDDFIVTHNTSEFFAWAELIGSKRRAIVSSKNVRQVIVKETQRMGLQGIVVVNSLADLEREGTYYLMTYDWLKGEGAECKGIGKPVRDARGSQRYAYLIQAPCPHCGQMLVRPVRQLVNPEGLILPEHPGIPPSFTPHFGYMCINPECSWVPDKYPKMRKLKGRKGRPPELVAGAAWASGEVPATRKRYTDYARKVHWLKCVLPIFKAEEKAEDAMKRIGPLFRGRMCQKCGYVARAYSPMRYRRVNKIRWGTIGIDEIHVMKGGYGSLQGRALLALKAKHRAGLSGTLMPNAPADPYWPLHWIFGGGTPAFPYFRTGDQGLSAYNSEFTASVFIYDEHDNVVSKKATPYLKSISRFHRLMAPKMSRRSYGDPLVVESLEAAGLVLPEIDYQILRVDPSEEQARLMVSAIDVFKVHFDRYKAEAEAAGLKLNSSRVLPLMMRLRVAATVPDLFNVQLAKQGMPPIYNGQPGGAKLPLIRDLAQAKVRAGQKVVIFSFFREMQRLIGEHVKHLDPIVFDTRWDEEERADMIELFHIDPSRRIMVASPLSLGEGVDLSPANTVICADLLWVPGKMAQAWSRILKALPEPRRCEIYRILMHRSIDEHMWNVFYAKQIAQEQAFDRRIVTRRETAIDIQAFVDRVMASRTEIMALLPEDRDDDLAYAPMRAAMGAMDTDERE